MQNTSNEEIAPRHKKEAARSLRFARFARKLHKWCGVLLALVFIIISITGGFIAFKNQLDYLQPSGKSGATGDINQMISPAEVAKIVLAMQLAEAKKISQINRIELRPAKRMYKVRLNAIDNWSSPREIQIDAIKGTVLNDGVRGDQLWADIHSFAVFGQMTKLIVMSLAGLILVWLGISGVYLFFYPIWIKKQKKKLI